MQRADLYTNAKNECQVAAVSDDFMLGLWANLQKSTRLKGVEFTELKFSMDVPKSFAHMAIGVRVMYMSVNPYAAPNTGRLVPLVCCIVTVSFPSLMLLFVYHFLYFCLPVSP